MSYHLRLKRSVKRGLFVGGDFGYIEHEDEGSGTVVAVPGFPEEDQAVSLKAQLFRLTGSARVAWRESRSPEIHLGGGAGLYYVRLRQTGLIPGFGSTGRRRGLPPGPRRSRWPPTVAARRRRRRRTLRQTDLPLVGECRNVTVLRHAEPG